MAVNFTGSFFHCIERVSPFISSKCIAFHSNCVSSVLILLSSLHKGMIYFYLSSCYFVPIFCIPYIHLLFILPCVTLPISPTQKALLTSNHFLYPLCSLCHFEGRTAVVKPRRWDSPLCVPGFSPTESNRAALWWHSDRAGTGHYQTFFFASYPSCTQVLCWPWQRIAQVALALWTPFGVPYLSRKGVLPVSIAHCAPLMSVIRVLHHPDYCDPPTQHNTATKWSQLQDHVAVKMFCVCVCIEFPFNGVLKMLSKCSFQLSVP